MKPHEIGAAKNDLYPELLEEDERVDKDEDDISRSIVEQVPAFADYGSVPTEQEDENKIWRHEKHEEPQINDWEEEERD